MKRKPAFKDLRLEVQFDIAGTFKICKPCGALNRKDELECWNCESLLFEFNAGFVVKTIIEKDL